MIRGCYGGVTAWKILTPSLGRILWTMPKHPNAEQRDTVRVELVAASLGCVAVVVALVIIWMARLTVTRDLYVSELGAQGEPTAAAFEVALLLIVAGGRAFVGAGGYSRVRAFALWTAAVSLWVGCGFFLFASQVTCTSGCPSPYGSTFTRQDFCTRCRGDRVCARVLGDAADVVREGHKVARPALAGILYPVPRSSSCTGGPLSLFRFQQGSAAAWSLSRRPSPSAGW